MNVAVIIPALNEQESIGTVVREVLAVLDGPVIVVDNGSTDATAGVARTSGALVVHEPRQGYGYACAAGAAAAGDHYDILVFMDGDGSDDVHYMQRLLDPIRKREADLVCGSRTLGRTGGQALLPHQRAGNALTVFLIGLLYGKRLTDVPPFRAIRRTVLSSLGMREMTYGWPIEMTVKCIRRGYRIAEVPVVARPRTAGRSKVSGTVKGTVLAAYYLLGLTLRYSISDGA